MPMEQNSHPIRIDQFFAGPGARADQWHHLLQLAEAWSSGSGDRAKYDSALNDLAVTEEFHAYPGSLCWGHCASPLPRMMRAR